MKMKAISITLRLLVLPAFFMIAMVFQVKKVLVTCWLFVRYGGELIHYDRNVNPVTIAEAYEKISNSEFITTE